MRRAKLFTGLALKCILYKHCVTVQAPLMPFVVKMYRTDNIYISIRTPTNSTISTLGSEHGNILTGISSRTTASPACIGGQTQLDSLSPSGDTIQAGRLRAFLA